MNETLFGVSKRQIVITLAPALAVLLWVALTDLFSNLEVPDLSRDVTATAELHPLTGALSSLGVLLWGAAVTVCAFSSALLRRAGQTRLAKFLFWSAVLTAYLLVDDLFMFHEELAPRYLLVPEEFVLALLGVGALAYFWAFRHIFMHTRYMMLVFALGCLGFSMGVDMVFGPYLERLGHFEYFVEDGAKWVGIAAWLSYFTHTGYTFVQNYSAALVPHTNIRAVASTGQPARRDIADEHLPSRA